MSKKQHAETHFETGSLDETEYSKRLCDPIQDLGVNTLKQYYQEKRVNTSGRAHSCPNFKIQRKTTNTFFLDMLWPHRYPGCSVMVRSVGIRGYIEKCN